jgi:uncharacterized repeat protein (TIGR03837 family)
MRIHCDIFCSVVDNFGDIGVSWRLARQLAHEHGLAVRLWVDDLVSFAKICPELNAEIEQQTCRGVEIRHWTESVFQTQAFAVADCVMCMFACKLPENYLAAMACQTPPPVWINLEYLSAENWVAGCHRLPSPHPSLPLTQYFFFPGFTADTGGLLLERDLLTRRAEFQANLPAQQAFWRSLGLPERAPNELRISLFCYQNAALPALLKTWQRSPQSIVCLVPENSYISDYIEEFKIDAGALKIIPIPFLEQDCYDQLLWACDVNFVRGEDSCVRAQWAGRPFVWQIYPQHDGVHWQKLRALSQLMGDSVLEKLWLAWNGEGDIATAWADFAQQREQSHARTLAWATQLSSNNLALNLLAFYRHLIRPS